MNKFKVGDIVTCRKKYADKFTRTKPGILCKVIDGASLNGYMYVQILSDIPQKDEIYEIKQSYFKLWKDKSKEESAKTFHELQQAFDIRDMFIIIIRDI